MCVWIKWTAELAETRTWPALNRSPGGRLGLPLSLQGTGSRQGRMFYCPPPGQVWREHPALVFIDVSLSLFMSVRACTKPLELHRVLFWNFVLGCRCAHCCRASKSFSRHGGTWLEYFRSVVGGKNKDLTLIFLLLWFRRVLNLRSLWEKSYI